MSRLASPRLALAFIALSLLIGHALLAPRPAGAADEGQGIVLPGSQPVQPGQCITLHWSRIDAISEMELLLSTDGGRTYREWVSPRLAPSATQFMWRVPRLAATEIRLRIRFNRGGREIEGAPTAPMRLCDAPQASSEPFGLPPLVPASGSEPGRSGPSGVPSTPLSGSSVLVAGARCASPQLRRPQPHAGVLYRAPGRSVRAGSVREGAAERPTPRSMPLRA